MTTPNQFEEGHYTNVDEFDALRVREAQTVYLELFNRGDISGDELMKHYNATTSPDVVELMSRDLPNWKEIPGLPTTVVTQASRKRT